MFQSAWRYIDHADGLVTLAQACCVDPEHPSCKEPAKGLKNLSVTIKPALFSLVTPGRLIGCCLELISGV